MKARIKATGVRDFPEFYGLTGVPDCEPDWQLHFGADACIITFGREFRIENLATNIRIRVNWRAPVRPSILTSRT
jgi:hypothetical protein